MQPTQSWFTLSPCRHSFSLHSAWIFFISKTKINLSKMLAQCHWEFKNDSAWGKVSTRLNKNEGGIAFCSFLIKARVVLLLVGHAVLSTRAFCLPCRRMYGAVFLELDGTAIGTSTLRNRSFRAYISVSYAMGRNGRWKQWLLVFRSLHLPIFFSLAFLVSYHTKSLRN